MLSRIFSIQELNITGAHFRLKDERFEQQWDVICAELKENSDDSILKEYLEQILPSIHENALVLSSRSLYSLNVRNARCGGGAAGDPPHFV